MAIDAPWPCCCFFVLCVSALAGLWEIEATYGFHDVGSVTNNDGFSINIFRQRIAYQEWVREYPLLRRFSGERIRASYRN